MLLLIIESKKIKYIMWLIDWLIGFDFWISIEIRFEMIYVHWTYTQFTQRKTNKQTNHTDKCLINHVNEFVVVVVGGGLKHWNECFFFRPIRFFWFLMIDDWFLNSRMILCLFIHSFTYSKYRYSYRHSFNHSFIYRENFFCSHFIKSFFLYIR